MPHVRICAGGGEQSPSLPRPGYSTHDIERCALSARAVALVYNWWSWYVRLAISGMRNKQQLWIPPGCAHGFLTLSDSAEFLYKTTDFYAPGSDFCVAWDDPELAITWPLDRTGAPQLSAKDQQGLRLQDAPCAP